jgi:hypothetical protein
MKGQLKPFKSVEEIAKKHRLDVSFIQRQLDMGEPIEHEHTKDHQLAMDIALQHLDEIPDYYTRLKKMEASAKKEHKKFKDVKESSEEQRYCPLCDKREGRSECSYGGKAWDKVSVRDHEYSMVRSELDTLVKAAERIKKKVGKGEGSLEAWVQSKITKAADYIDTAADYIASGEMEESFTINPTAHKVAAKRRKIEALTTSSNSNEADVAKRKLGKTAELPKVKKEEKLVDKILGELQEEDPCWSGYKQQGMKKKGKKIVPNCVPVGEETKSGDSSLHDWFSKSKSSDGKPGWVQLGGKYAGKPCAKQPGQTTKPKCGSSKMSAEMSPEEEDRAARRKRKEDPNPERVGKAINVATEEFVDEDACKEKVKSRYKVWPSAYASGALVKCRKVGASNWGNKTKNENVTIEDASGNTFAEVVDIIKPEPIKGFKSQIEEATRLQGETGNIIAVILSWRGKTYSIRMFFPQLGMPSKKDVTTEIQKVYPGALVLQYNVSGIRPGMPLIQVVNSKSKNYLLNNGTIGEETIKEVAAWQRKEGKSKSGGLNEKGRKSYEKENPGSDLKRPQPEGGSRRDSFCARMKGMKKKLTSAKTANDPDSRINKSLRAWNC